MTEIADPAPTEPAPPPPAARALGRPIKLGLAGVVLAALGYGLFSALTVPPFRWPDEQAHAGYAFILARGALPTIETRIPVPEGAEALSQRLERDRRRRGSVWVANHPPGGYLLAAPLAAAAEHTARGDLANLGLRAVNVVSAALAALLTFGLGRELGNARVGLLAAAFFVSFPSVSFLLSLGMTDGISLVATMACLLASVRILSGATDRRDYRNLSVALVAAALTRLTALGVGLLLTAGTLLVVARRERRVPLREALVTGLPAVVYSAWFWVGNHVRYGDVAASKYLLQRFGREGGKTLGSTLLSGGIWDAAARRLFSNLVAEPVASGAMPGCGEVAYRATEAVIVICAIAVVVLLVRDQRRSAVAPPGMRRLALAPWLALLATFFVSWVMMAKHVSGGGTPHVRYMIAGMPIIAVFAATAMLRVRVRGALGRYVPAALAVLALIALFVGRVQQTAVFAEWMPLHTDAPAGTVLSQPSGPGWLRIAVLLVGFAGTAIMIATLGVIAARPPEDERS